MCREMEKNMETTISGVGFRGRRRTAVYAQ